ncbi:GNAT family N-acetyltransferase [Marinovum sp.]|uniref:GNAT family N-acetyltransferase n=1 Tax=Marinovum sp. TaxID=2024839 RepID=UPI002B269021|nr:GNAT family N-acetyltransferase [Marinovum sp.]
MSADHPDLPAIAALHPEDRQRHAQIARCLSQGAGLIAYRTEGVLRGYLLYTRGAGGAPVIERLYVAPGWRRRGIEDRLTRRLATAADPAPGSQPVDNSVTRAAPACISPPARSNRR